MSHFTVLVASPAAEDVDALLEPFDENLEVPRYLKRTREQIIADGRKGIEDYATKGLYAEFIADPEAYIQKCIDKAHGATAGHLAYIAVEFPKRLQWTDEEVYAHEIRWLDEDDVDENGAEWSERNPNSKWDWWVIGGRWSGHLTLRSGGDADQATKGGVDLNETLPTYAVLLADGTWIARGEMGWFGISHDDVATPEKWPELWRKAVDSIPDDHVLTIVDCHI